VLLLLVHLQTGVALSSAQLDERSPFDPVDFLHLPFLRSPSVLWIVVLQVLCAAVEVFAQCYF
jgi:hypothetical protein